MGDGIIHLTIDGVPVNAKDGDNVFKVATENGIYIPNLNYTPELTAADGYIDDMLCVVKVEGNPRLQQAPRVLVKEGMVVWTKNDLINRQRKGIMEKLLKEHVGDCHAPCTLACPAHTYCQRYIQLAGEKRYEDAIHVLRDRNPMILACGYVCPRFCEMECRRQLAPDKAAVGINDVKRFLADWYYSLEKLPMPEIAPPTGKKVAVVGSGPAGLTCAYYLTTKGHKVTMFEAAPLLGGMLRYGIPEYRLPKEKLDKELDLLTRQMGVEVKANMRFCKDFTVADLEKDFDRAFIAVGAQKGMPFPVPSFNNVPGVVNGIDFLRDVADGKRPVLGDFVSIVGGGNVSIDVARTCVRLGVKRVLLTCILSEREMPALPVEVRGAREEGVEIMTLAGPIRLIKDEKTGRMDGVEYTKYTHFDNFTGEGKIKGSEFILKPDTLMISIGQIIDQDSLKDIARTEIGRVQVDASSMKVKGSNFLYSGGDCVFDLPATVVQCIAHGRLAAENIDAELRGQPVPVPTPIDDAMYRHRRGMTHSMPDNLYADVKPIARHWQREVEPEERIHDFREVEHTLTEEELLEECKRCMQCGCADSQKCLLRKVATEIGITDQPIPDKFATKRPLLDEKNPFFDRDMGKCVHCFRCVRMCRDVRHCGAYDVEEAADRLNITMRQVDTRLNTSDRPGHPLGGTCESCGACLDVCPTNALYPKKMERTPSKVVTTTCPYCGCGCGIEVGVKDNKIWTVRGQKDHPMTEGHLCVKGRFGLDYVGSPDRLTTPMIRGADGQLKPCSWDEALDLVASKLMQIKKEHGPDSIEGLCSAKCTNEEDYIFQKFMRAVVGTNNVDHCARLCHSSTVTGLVFSFGSGVMTNSIRELEFAEVILITGSNTTEAHPLIGKYIRAAVKKHGAKLLIADPRQIDLVRYADKHVRQRSGTDVMLFNAIMHVIIEEKLANEEFIRERCEGYEEFARVVAECTPEKAELITGVSVEDIRYIARTYAKAKTGSIVYSMGITQHSTGVDNVRTMANLSMLCGHVGRESTGVNPLRGQSNVQGACDVGGLPNVYSGYQKVDLPEMKAKFEKFWGVDNLSLKVGMPLTVAFNEAIAGKVKAIYVMGENPMVSDPNLGHLEEALKKLDFLVVQDIFLTPTAKFAHVVLPATCLFEKQGTQTSTERRVQQVNPCVEPPGQARHDWDIICDLARRMGYPMPHYKDGAEITDELAACTPVYGGISFKRLGRVGLHWPCPSADHPGTKFVHKGKFSRGLGAFGAIPFKEPKELPDADYPIVMTTGRLLQNFHTGTMTRRSEGIEKFSGTYVEMHLEDATKLGIQHNDMVIVETRRGRLVVPAVVPSRIKQGHVFLPFHFEEMPANRLTIDALDPYCKMAELKVCACRVRKATPEEAAEVHSKFHLLEA
jgi:formate dehydrogenase major subunit